MSVTRQLYQLQEFDLQIETSQQALDRLNSQLGDDQMVMRAQKEVSVVQQNLEELQKRQHSTEWEIDALTNKATDAEEQLYSGKVTNPKELTSLQQEVGILKTQRSKLEDEVLETMEQIELTEAHLADKDNTLKKIKAEWQVQQQQLSTNIEQLKATLSDINRKQQQLLVQLDSQTIELYQELKKHKRTAVAKVEQGICRGCQISLSAAELQRARAGDLAQCSSCGRILFLP